MMCLLGLVYISIMLAPLLHKKVLLSSTGSSIVSSLLTLDGWRLMSANFTSEAFHMEFSSSSVWQCPIHDPSPSIILPNPNRTIALIHVGKAGGVTLRRMTVIYCKLFFVRKTNYTPETIANKTQQCIAKRFPDPKAMLAYQTKHYFHLKAFNDTELATSTSFLVTLRNPIERIISTYRYTHTPFLKNNQHGLFVKPPLNCLPLVFLVTQIFTSRVRYTKNVSGMLFPLLSSFMCVLFRYLWIVRNCNSANRGEVWRPRGCEVEKHQDDQGLIQNKLYFECFPSPAMEDFAQSLLSPWSRGNLNASLTLEQRRECRYLAREMVQGHGTMGSAPHMLYNYGYYMERSVWKYPTKEVFGIRTEHESDDIRALDELLGGNGNLRENTEVSHGSEGYASSPLTAEAYQKLCCVLEMEIAIYEELLERVVNLDRTSKLKDLSNLRDKCGITTSWTEWRFVCQKKLRRDLRVLKPSLIVTETNEEFLSHSSLARRRKGYYRDQMGG